MTLTRRTLLGTSVLTVLVGCAAQPESTPLEPSRTAPKVSAPSASATTQPNPGQHEIAMEVLKVMTTWNTATDTTQTSGDLRARTYFTDDLAASIIAPERNAASGEWFAHAESISIPRIIAVEGTDSLPAGSLAYEVSWNWKDTTGNISPGDSVRLYNLAMLNTAQGWKVRDYTYEEFPRHN